MKKEMAKTEQDQEGRKVDTHEVIEHLAIAEQPTPNYDIVVTNYKKLRFMQSAKFIEMFCNALRKDWYPEADDQYFAKTPAARNNITGRIYNDWSNNRHNKTDWGDGYIFLMFPAWLKNPKYAQTWEEKKGEKLAEKVRNFLELVEPQADKVVAIAEKLPEPPNIEQESTDEGVIAAEDDKTLTPIELYEMGMRALDKAWYALTNKEHLPGPKEDVFNEYIKPSDKFRLRLWKGLDEQRATDYHNALAWTEMVIKRALNTWDEIQKERTKAIKE